MSEQTPDTIPDTIIEFWFSEKTRKHWFKSTPEFDQEIAARFKETLLLAANGQLDAWTSTATGALALVILLDQFSRNIYRGTAEVYSNDALARRIAKQAIDHGFDQQLQGWQQSFLYMPFMHSETLEDQEYSGKLHVDAGLDNARYALHHRDIVRRFGRFPHRNKILDRKSTPEELVYLASEEAFKG